MQKVLECFQLELFENLKKKLLIGKIIFIRNSRNIDDDDDDEGRGRHLC